jgi:hypothetical protein
MALWGQIQVNSDQTGGWEAKRRSGPPVRREPEPSLDSWAARVAAGRPMGNDVHLYDWTVHQNGRRVSNLEEEPIEHRYGDGAVVLMAKVFAAAAGLTLSQGSPRP